MAANILIVEPKSSELFEVSDEVYESDRNVKPKYLKLYLTTLGYVGKTFPNEKSDKIKTNINYLFIEEYAYCHPAINN